MKSSLWLGGIMVAFTIVAAAYVAVATDRNASRSGVSLTPVVASDQAKDCCAETAKGLTTYASAEKPSKVACPVSSPAGTQFASAEAKPHCDAETSQVAAGCSTDSGVETAGCESKPSSTAAVALVSTTAGHCEDKSACTDVHACDHTGTCDKQTGQVAQSDADGSTTVASSR